MNFRCFAGCNASLVSAAEGLAAKELPKTRDVFANIPVRWALRRCPYPKSYTLTCLFPGTFSVLGQQEGFWGGNMRPRGFSRTGKQPQVEELVFQLPAHPHHCRATPSPFFSLLCSSLGCVHSTPQLCPVYSNQGSSFTGVLKVKCGGENPLRSSQCFFSSFFYQKG